MNRNTLRYDRPAEHWVEALPLGNGKLGAMVFGGIPNEHLQLNEESLWSGYPREHNHPGAKDFLPQVCQAVFDGDYARADELAKHMQGPYTQSILPQGNLYLEFDHTTHSQNYNRWLDPDTVVQHNEYDIESILYTPQAFISATANALVLRLTCSQSETLSPVISLISPLHARLQVIPL